MSRHWCHWCMLSPSEWENRDHENGDKLTMQLIEDHLKKQLIHLDMISYLKTYVFYQYYLIQFQ